MCVMIETLWIMDKEGRMPVCILGMHRSGTSMVTRILNLCGLSLGHTRDLLDPDSGLLNINRRDNPQGYWENTHFVLINNAILEQFGGNIYVPPILEPGWTQDERLAPLRQQARDLLAGFDPNTAWGWKDPRNTLTLPFWHELVPDLRLIVCVRNPLEVAESLTSRNHGETRPFGLNLWQHYYDQLRPVMDDMPCLITHFSSYFFDPHGEIQRLTSFAGLPPTDEQMQLAAASISNELYRNPLPDSLLDLSDFDPSLKTQYEALCEQAGAVFQSSMASPGFQQQQHMRATNYLYQVVSSQALEIESLQGTITHKTTEFEQAIAEIRVAQQQQIDQLKSHHESAMTALKADYESRLTTQQHDYETQQHHITEMLRFFHKDIAQPADILAVINTPGIALALRLLYRALVPLRLRQGLRSLLKRPG